MPGLKTKPEYAGAALACSLGLALLKKCKVNTWSELGEAIAAGNPFVSKTLRGLDLGAAQLQALAENGGILDLLRISPASIPAFCSECGEFFLTSDTAPAKCMVTSDCTGKPGKVAAATGAQTIPEDDVPDQWVPEEQAAPSDTEAVSPEEPAESVVLEPAAVLDPAVSREQEDRIIEIEDLGEDASFSEFVF